MLIKTLLNKLCKYKSFVYGNVKFIENDGPSRIEIEIRPRKNGHPLCSKCLKEAPKYGYSDSKARKFEHVPLWGLPVFFIYRVRRVNCPYCGVTVEKLPWSDGKNTLTKPYMQFLARWAKSLSWAEIAIRFKTSWGKVFRAVEYVVEWGLKRRSLENIDSIGVDEIQWKKGHKYLTLVYQITPSCTRLLWIARERSEESFSKFFDLLGERSQQIKYVCSDMWRPYLKVIKDRVSQALHILDRFHIVADINKAMDEVRAGEYRQMKEDGYEPLLKKSRWALLKRPENLTEKQEVKLKDLLKYNLASVRAYLLKEDFQAFWEYVSPVWAEKFLDRWITRVMRSKIEPLKKKAKTIRRHKNLILNWFKAKKQFSSGVVEGLNTKVKVTMRKSYGFREYRTAEIALYHALGKLPEPESTHEFW